MTNTELLTKRLFHIESDRFKNLEVGDVLHIDGLKFLGYGEKVLSLIDNTTFLSPDEKHSLVRTLDGESVIRDNVLQVLKRLLTTNCDNYESSKKLKVIVGEVFFAINKTSALLPSRLKSIFLTELKYLNLWIKTLPNGNSRKIYEVKIVDVYKFHEGDENHFNDYQSQNLDFITKLYWGNKHSLQMKKLEIIFQGKLVVTNCFQSLKTINYYNRWDGLTPIIKESTKLTNTVNQPITI